MTELLFDGRPVRRTEVVAAGLSTAARDGRLRRVLHGVYVDAAVPDDLVVRAHAAGLVLPSGAVLCRTTAAWLYGVDVVAINEHLATPELEVLAPAAHAAARRRRCRGFSAAIDGDDVTEVYGLPVTTPARTALDLARWRTRPDALAYVDALLHAGAVTRDALVLALPRLAAQPWAEQAREIVALADAGAESPMESRMRLRYADAGLPRLQCQVWVTDEYGRRRYRLDCGLPERRFGLEYDGVAGHGPERERHDADRRAWITARGWDVLVCRREDVLGRGYAFERAVGERLGIVPRLVPLERRLRTYAGQPWLTRARTDVA